MEEDRVIDENCPADDDMEENGCHLIVRFQTLMWSSIPKTKKKYSEQILGELKVSIASLQV